MDGEGGGVRTGAGTGGVGMRTQMAKGSGREAGPRAAARTGSVLAHSSHRCQETNEEDGFTVGGHCQGQKMQRALWLAGWCLGKQN